MIGIVLVSHSEPLAQAAADLAFTMVHGDRPPLRIASGAADGFGTDATAIARAIDSLADVEGVVILTDLGSAVLSSELALELRESGQPVAISHGPFVEGATTAVVRAAAGGSLEEVAGEADAALGVKRGPAPTEPEVPPAPAIVRVEERLPNPLGIHSRPAAALVRIAGRHPDSIRITNITTGKGPVRADSMVGLLSLAAVQGDVLRIDGEGPDAAASLAAVRQAIREGFGELA